jgi:hypothetical protein
MRCENDGIKVWFDVDDAPEAPVITVSVRPIDASHQVEVLLRRRGRSAEERLPVRWTWNDYVEGVQHFRAALPGLSAGDRYTVVCTGAGRRAKSRLEAPPLGLGRAKQASRRETSHGHGRLGRHLRQ